MAVALDTGGAAASGEWIRKANSTYPSLIDQNHVVAELYGMINVPSAVWIDEEGRIVRPAEPAGGTDVSRAARDPKTGQISDEARAKMQLRRQYYYNAIRDWVQKGEASVHALAAQDVQRRTQDPSQEDARGAATFRMGAYLHQQGHREDAQRYFSEAARLRPHRWNYRRQIWNLAPGTDVRAGMQAAREAPGAPPFTPTLFMEGLPE
jgi:hypothetical protein